MELSGKILKLLMKTINQYLFMNTHRGDEKLKVKIKVSFLVYSDGCLMIYLQHLNNVEKS